jgi:hypothetical protein
VLTMSLFERVEIFVKMKFWSAMLRMKAETAFLMCKWHWKIISFKKDQICLEVNILTEKKVSEEKRSDLYFEITRQKCLNKPMLQSFSKLICIFMLNYEFSSRKNVSDLESDL